MKRTLYLSLGTGESNIFYKKSKFEDFFKSILNIMYPYLEEFLFKIKFLTLKQAEQDPDFPYDTIDEELSFLKLEWEETVKPKDSIYIFSMYYSPDTNIFYLNDPKYDYAVPIMKLKTLAEYLELPLETDFENRALSYKITGDLETLFKESEIQDADSFSLLVQMLTKGVDSYNSTLDTKSRSKLLYKMVNLVSALQVYFYHIYMSTLDMYEYKNSLYREIAPSFAASQEGMVDSNNFSAVSKTLYSYSTLIYRLEYAFKDKKELLNLQKAVNREEISNYYLDKSNSVESAEKAFKELVTPLKDRVSSRAASFFNKAADQSNLDKIDAFIDKPLGQLDRRNELLNRKFSVIFNKISKIILKEVG